MNYIKVDQVTNLTFYQVPKVLFKGQYKSMSNNARITYSALRDRMDLSIKNNWHDEEGNVFIYYSRENLAEDLGVSDKSIRTYMKELSKLELIQEKRQGLNKPNIIYICMPLDTENTLTGKSYRSKPVKVTVQDGQDLPTNDTYINYTESNNTNKNIKGVKNKFSLYVFLKNKNDINCEAIEVVKYYLEVYSNYFDNELKYTEEEWNDIFEDILYSEVHDDLGGSIDTFKEAIDKHFETKYKHKEMYLLHNFKGVTKDNRLYESGIL